MQNGEVHEIVRLEGQAAKTEKISSADRWHAARLIHGQLEHKTFRQLSADIKEAGGKGSIGHLERMKRCWELVGMLHWESLKDDFASYPNFATVYGSDEIRKHGEDDDEQGSQRKHRESEDFTADGTARRIAEDVDSIMSNPAKRRNLTDEGKENLRRAHDQLRRYWRESKG